jgi:hypothetical protein
VSIDVRPLFDNSVVCHSVTKNCPCNSGLFDTIFVLLKFKKVGPGDVMKIGHVAWMVCFLGLTSIFLVNCGSSSPTSSNGATATPTPSSSAGNQLYAFVLESSNGSSNPTMVKISGPYPNSGSSNFSFSLPAVSGSTVYVVAGLFDTALNFTIPSGAQVITPAAGDYGQYNPTGCLGNNSSSPTQYTSSASGINFTMQTSSGACTFGTGGSGVQYSPVTGSSVVLSGTISQSGL